jgi:hypothetical protein
METPSSNSGQERHIDNKPNVSQSADFSSYREILSSNSGINSTGVSEKDTYDKVIKDHNTVFASVPVGGGELCLPLAATNGALGYFNKDEIPSDSLIIILPHSLAPEESIDELRKGHTILMPRQKILSDNLVDSYISKIRSVEPSELETELVESGGQLMPNTGFAEFIGVSRYDISGCGGLKKEELPDEIIIGDTVSTTSLEVINAKLTELIKLHKKVFKRQAEEIGYYDGLTTEEIVKLIKKGNFTPVATFNYDTDKGEMGEAMAFALFASNLTDLNELSWLNPEAANRVIGGMKETDNPVISIPYVIVSEGAANFPLITKIAAQKAISGTNATELFTLTKTSSASINYTPAIINRTLKQQGFLHKESCIEATYLTKI